MLLLDLEQLPEDRPTSRAEVLPHRRQAVERPRPVGARETPPREAERGHWAHDPLVRAVATSMPWPAQNPATP